MPTKMYEVNGRNAPYFGAVAVTPSDSTDLSPEPTRALYIGVTGDVTLDTRGGDSAVLFKAVPVGVLYVSCTRVRATGTTATQILALY